MPVPVALFLLPLVASAHETAVTGTLRGYMATVTKAPRVTDKSDPAVRAERSFVVDTSQGYYFPPNVGRAMLRRYAKERVRVVGDLDGEHHSIRASRVEWKSGDHWKQVWSRRGPFPLGARSLVGLPIPTFR